MPTVHDQGQRPRGRRLHRGLVFGWGNPSRGDDALGPTLIEKLSDLHQQKASTSEFLTDFQLQIEHALDLVDRKQVLFVDASQNCTAPFEVTTLQPTGNASFTTHAMSPESVMQVFRDLQGIEPPTCLMLAIRGEQFELGTPLSEAAESNLAQALNWCQHWLHFQAPTL
jgi:hydrogenase maturation protease